MLRVRLAVLWSFPFMSQKRLPVRLLPDSFSISKIIASVSAPILDVQHNVSNPPIFLMLGFKLLTQRGD